MIFLLRALAIFVLISQTVGIIAQTAGRVRVPRFVLCGAVLLLNITVNSVLIFSPERLPGLLPVFLCELIFFGYALFVLLTERVYRKSILTRFSIQEAFDNLPEGICFFDGNGLPVLINQQMYNLGFMLTGKNVQHMDELREGLQNSGRENRVVCLDKAKTVFLFPGDKAWRFTEHPVQDEAGNNYIQYLAADVTELYRKRTELMEETKRLRETEADLRRLSKTVTAAAREEEVLSMKMKVHDDMGRSLLATRRLLQRNQPLSDMESVLGLWEEAARLLEADNRAPQESDALQELKEAASALGLSIEIAGEFPAEPERAYLMVSAMRECVTNAVRHAGATRMRVEISEKKDCTETVITNNGRIPEKGIIEGGGLSNLRRRVERVGGMMRISASPSFSLQIGIPKEEKEL